MSPESMSAEFYPSPAGDPSKRMALKCPSERTKPACAGYKDSFALPPTEVGVWNNKTRLRGLETGTASRL